MKNRYFSVYSGLPKEVYYLFVARLVNSMGFFIAPLFTLILTQKLGMGKAEAGTTMSLLILTQAPCVLLGGKLADHIGRKRMLVSGSIASALLYLVCSLGFTGRTMVYVLIAAADCIAFAYPAVDAMLADLTRPEERRPAYSLLYLGTNIGMALSPIVGGLLFTSHLSLLFVLDAVTTFASMAIVVIKVNDPFVRRKKAEDNTPGISLLSALKGVPVLTTFILLLFFYDFCYSQWSFMLPAQFGDIFSQNGAKLYSTLCSVNAVTVIVVTPLITRLTRKLRPLKAVALGGAFYLAAYLGFFTGGSYILYLIFAFVFTLGEICSTIQIGAFVANRAPSECLGRINAFYTFVRGAASALGPLAMGQILTAAGYGTGWLATAAIVLAAASAMLLLNVRDRKTAPDSGPRAEES